MGLREWRMDIIGCSVSNKIDLIKLTLVLRLRDQQTSKVIAYLRSQIPTI